VDRALDLYVESLANFRASRGYAIHFVLPRLEAAGIRVRVLDRPDPKDRAAAAFLHVDLTVLPERYHGIRQLYERTINGDALSIHRDLYSTLKLRPGDTHTGPVIAKTVLNNHGRPELRMWRHRNAWTRAAYHLRKIVEPGFKRRLMPRYQVYDSIDQVPEWVWRDSRMIVEKFVFPTLDLPIVKHRCYYLFDVELNMRQVFDDVFCSGKKIIINEVADSPIPDAVYAVRRHLKLDYGAIDYFLVDGEAIVVDANIAVGANAEWLKRFAFRREFHDRIADRLIDFVHG